LPDFQKEEHNTYIGLIHQMVRDMGSSYCRHMLYHCSSSAEKCDSDTECLSRSKRHRVESLGGKERKDFGGSIYAAARFS
jgi:hypothetical protein